MAVEAPLSKSKLSIKLPAGIWALGFVSMFMDVSSEMIHALLPIYLVTVLGASTLSIGFIEGMPKRRRTLRRSSPAHCPTGSAIASC